MVTLNEGKDIDYGEIYVDSEWNESEKTELVMHTIHAYPAKFPAFIASKAFEYAKNEGVDINKVADIFCGCGTVALEAKSHNFDFWGCDINPVATLIARTKSRDYDSKKMEEYYEKIIMNASIVKLKEGVYKNANERLKYWFTERSYIELLKIYISIEEKIDNEKYREAFECIFSSILKACSKWLMKSIKPQVDPNKKEVDVRKYFTRQYKKFLKAINELEDSNSKVEIQCHNFLS